MPALSPLVRRARGSLMFWLFVAVVVAAILRSIFPVGGFDEVRTGAEPIEVAASPDGVWVLNFGDLTVSLIRPSDQEILVTSDLGEGLAPALSANGDGAWVIMDEGTSLVRVAPDGEVGDPVDLTEAFDEKAQDLVAGDGFVWVVSPQSSSMVRLDTATGELDDPVDLGTAGSLPTLDEDGVLWLAQPSGFGRYDPETGEALGVTETGFRIRDFVPTDRAIFALADVEPAETRGTLVRLDPDDGSVLDEVEIDDARLSHLAVEGAQLFLPTSGGELREYSTEPLTLLATEKVAVSDKDLKGVVVVDDVVWVADGTNGIVHQPIDGIEGIQTGPDAGLG